ncbi:VWA domain-containing protein [Sedimentitalea sp. JM2-8]|uniref:VWA domain-containing protein n=1 Tax=Sedimentitalea xiamensis TaxID=3050037 RepID=A0ABT7FKN2_9RHOB|nr:VWA domain-containing protein [Sedimentitalea xiamensis]MDK3075314.1 VWA domain-containing protein [Sedimentitalea xiamensis]
MPEFATPWAFVLLAVPVLVTRLASARRSTGAGLVVPAGVKRRMLASRAAQGGIAIPRYALLFAIWALLVIALAGPRQIAPVQGLPISGRDMMLALDLSGSMVREDFQLGDRTVTRLDALKEVAAGFVRNRGGDRVGLVVFGSDAYVAAPLTFDVQSVAETVETMVIGISGRATNISEALGLTLKRLRESDAESRVVILLSDGASNAGEATPRDVAKLAAAMGVRIHTIAMGPKDLESHPDERGVVDAAMLKAVADLGSGEMFRVRTTEDLRAVAEAIDRLEPTARAGLSAEIYRDFWIWPAMLAGLGCLWLGWRAP